MASEKILESKKAKVAALTEMLQDSVSFVLVDYKGISVEDDTKLRKELREAGVHYVVEKNSMLRFAFKNMGIDAFDEVLHGTTAVALSKDDQTAPARVLGKFAADHEDFFNLKAGYVEGVAYDASGVEKAVQDSVEGSSAGTAGWFPAGSDPEAGCYTAGSCGQQVRRYCCISIAEILTLQNVLFNC